MILRELMYGYNPDESFHAGEGHFIVEEYRGSWVLAKLGDLGLWIWDLERSRRKHLRTIDPAPDALALKAHRRSAKKHIQERENPSS